jgi:hypothetical protein
MKITMQQLKSLIREAVTDIDDSEDEDLVTWEEMYSALEQSGLKDIEQNATRLEKYINQIFGGRDFSKEAQALLCRKYKKVMRKLTS